MMAVRHNAMKTIAVISQKGGAGKTTIATNLAVAAVQDGKAVLVLDLDQQPNAFGWYQTREDKQGLTVVPTHHAAIPSLLEGAAREGVDVVLVDTAGKTEAAARAAVETCDVVLVPCEPSPHDLRAIQDTVELCSARGVVPHIVLNKVEATSPLTDEARSVLGKLGARVRLLPCTIGSRRVFKYSAIDGRGVVELEPSGKAADEIRALYGALQRLHGKTTKARPTTPRTKTVTL
jgi:chromosome partitioning protein